MAEVAHRLCRAAIDAGDVAAWRAAALEVLGSHVRFERALFHELSPRVPLERGAVVGFEVADILATMGHWDRFAVELGALRDLALTQDGVATDGEAFRGRRARGRWRRATASLGIVSAMAAHLILDGRITAVAFLGRRRDPPFSSAERRSLSPLLPVLTVCDALARSRGEVAIGGPPVGVRCQDQRLTGRQRQVVEHVALGQTNAEIGAALGISPNTVRNLLVDVRRRLGAANRAEVVRLAVLR